MRWVRGNADELKVDKEKIGLWGAGHGASVAALVADTPDRKELDGKIGGYLTEAVNVQALRAAAGLRIDDQGLRDEGPFAIYVGKLAPNKGTQFLIDVIRQADLDWPLVIASDGPDRPSPGGRRTRNDFESSSSWTCMAAVLTALPGSPEMQNAREASRRAQFQLSHFAKYRSRGASSRRPVSRPVGRPREAPLTMPSSLRMPNLPKDSNLEGGILRHCWHP